MKAYVERRTTGCSVRLGGDRGAGRTSMVLKVIERLRWHRAPRGKEYNPGNSLAFPRPFPIRVHGPSVLGNSPQVNPDSRAAFRLFTEAIHLALCDEYGEMFRGKAGDDPVRQEMAAQFRVELDAGPKSSRLREMWAHFSVSATQLDPLLNGGLDCPIDQMHRELVAFDTSLRMCREIHSHRDSESRLKNVPRDGRPIANDDKASRSDIEQKTDQEAATWARAFLNFMSHGGHLINPLVGFIVGAVVFVAAIKENGDIPVSLLLAILASFVTTLLLNLVGAAHHAGKFISDNSLASLERTLPVLLHRIEAAGLFPVIIVDELDSVYDPPTNATRESSQLVQQLGTLAMDLKSFVADQAFVCFLAPRKFYEEVHDGLRDVQSSKSLERFFTHRILISHRPEHLLDYLHQRLLSPDPANQWMVEFMKRLYLYRAEGNLAALRECIAIDQRPDGSIDLVRYI